MSPQATSHLRIFPAITLAAFLLPVLVGLILTVAPAFGYLPAIGSYQLNLEPFRSLLSHPSFPGALSSTITSGLLAVLISLVSSLWIALSLHGSRLWPLLERCLAPLLALPHAAFAIGFTFLIAPSGWLLRIISPTLTGFDYPPDWIIVGDPWGLSLTLTMIIKEVPFLLLMIFSGLSRLDVRRTIWVGRSLGYHRSRIWTRLILPQLYPMLRLPVLAVLAYSLSVVDLALITGPSVPPTLAVLIDRWFNDPDVSLRLVGAAGAVSMLLLSLFCVAAVLAMEFCLKKLMVYRLINGSRKGIFDRTGSMGALLASGVLGASMLSAVILILWSLAATWRFPDFFPTGLSFRYWLKILPRLTDPLITSLAVGLASSLIALILVIGCFENERELPPDGRSSLPRKTLWVVYLPLIVPQIGFLFGIQIALLSLHLEGRWLSLIWSHLVFVLPYVFLTLANSYRTYDQRYYSLATILGSSQWRSFLMVKLPMLTKPILFSFAVGFAVSIAQYLPTLYVGAGRFTTITTETVNLASGSDRRVIAVYALCQFILPFLLYAAAILLPAAVFRKRRAMQD